MNGWHRFELSIINNPTDESPSVRSCQRPTFEVFSLTADYRPTHAYFNVAKINSKIMLLSNFTIFYILSQGSVATYAG